MKKPFFSLTLSAFGQVLKEQDKFIKPIGEVILIPANFERQQNLATAHKDDDALGDEDLIDVLLRVKKDRSLEFPITNDNIKEDNKAAERRSKGNSTINGAHIVKDDQNNSMKRKKAEQGSNQPKKKLKGKCFNCGKIGHKCMDCRAPKKGKIKDQENMIESNKECDDLCAMFSEYNLVRNPHKW
ncbi:hypothetical protein T459_31826 [Capsicum annuum]|uniref:CCHC-type domain-containing protein n=1 Tax=Capsicum annuum TaxID=4072 RepID=A0A2G2Y3M5_CAPAN|nr:hypothetical protein T459_31826 [Capsicum annuum]